MKYRKLRIAWSVAWGVAGLLLIVLWVRSYWWVDFVRRQDDDFSAITTLYSYRGGIHFSRGPNYLNPDTGLVYFSNPASDVKFDPEPPLFEWRVARRSGWWVSLTAPHWFLAAICGSFAAVAWFKKTWRFSLRTLLIGMTVAAIGLGCIVYEIRR